MPYSAEIIHRARKILEARKADRESENREKLYRAYETVPELKTVDQAIRLSMAQAAQAVFAEGVDAAAAMQKVRQENLALQKKRQALIEANFAPGYLNEEPVCAHCGGSGYIGATMCRCLEMLCRDEQKKELALLTNGNEAFAAFRLEYYSDRVDSKFGASPRKIMEHNLRYCRRYAESFPEGGNLLFVGGTGLGKTFLSACIANVVADKGVSIAYESAPHLFSKLERNRFNPDAQSRLDADRIVQCELLILDDLGTEMPGTFVTAALYSLLNDRLLAGRNTIISTNLNNDEIAQRYSMQIASRLQGSFKRLPFVGEDIRVLKSKGV